MVAVLSGVSASPAAAAQWKPGKPILGVSTNTPAGIPKFEKSVRTQAGVISVFADFDSPFPREWAEVARQRNASLLIAWEPWESEQSTVMNQPEFQLSDITRGDYDTYIRRFAADAAESGVPVLIRPMPEMNGNWRPWALGYNGNPPDGQAYVDAYRHIVEVARDAGGTGITWVWNPIVVYEAHLPYPQGSFPLLDLYPGDDVVDWVALDGYNWGSARPWGWKTFDEVFGASITEVRRIAPGKPLMIAEIGCAPGARKAAWVRNALARSEELGIGVVAWFEHNKETDWRIAHNARVAGAARSVVNGWHQP